MKNRTIYALLGVALITLLILYKHLGGFKKIEVLEISGEGAYRLEISGRNYEGKMGSPAWKNLFIEMRDSIGHGKLEEPITIIYLRPLDRGKTIEAFIGAVRKPGQQLPAGFTEKSVTRKGVLRVNLSMHPVVMPSPELVRKRIRVYARIHRLVLDSLMIEKYHPDNSLTVEIPYL